MRISVVGLGKLGAPIVAVLAAKGHRVVGIDLSETRVNQIARGIAPIEEPHLQEVLIEHRDRISATGDWQKAICETDVTYIIVPTPSGANGAFKNDHVLSAIGEVGRVLATKLGYHLIVVNSTVMPGSMDGPIRQRLEYVSGRKVGIDVGLCYNPAFIALGNVLEGLLHPDFVLIGESDQHAGDMLEAVCRGVVGKGTSITRMNFINAELTKIAVNTYVTMKISFANMLSEICGRLAGADVDVVTDAIGRDSRIGKKYLRGATAYGGPCFPRDTIAFATMARQAGTAADLAEATDAVNARQTPRLRALIADRLPAGSRLAVLGLSYKPHTLEVERSPGVDLAAALAEAGYHVTVHDPMAVATARSVLGERVTYASTLDEAVALAAGAVLVTPWPEYRSLTPAAFATEQPLVVDCWGMLLAEHFVAADLVRLGRSEGAPQASAGIPASAASITRAASIRR
jgi:UDPglucose 6-dehydrogenase